MNKLYAYRGGFFVSSEPPPDGATEVTAGPLPLEAALIAAAGGMVVAFEAAPNGPGIDAAYIRSDPKANYCLRETEAPDDAETRVLRWARAAPIGGEIIAGNGQADYILRRHAFEFPEVRPGVFVHANPTWNVPPVRITRLTYGG
jgi:hypothetical protein